MTTQPPTEIKSVADALDAGIALADAGQAPPAPVVDDADEGGTDGTSTDDSSGDEAGTEGTPDGAASGGESGDAGDGTGQEGDGAAAADDESAGDGTGGEGGEGDGTDAAADPAVAGKAAGKPGEKKPDPLTDPIPNALKPATKERIRTLVERTKTAETSLATATSERDELIKAVTDTGATPEQYAATLDYLELVNSGDRNKLMKAANFMIRELSALSRVGGFRIPGVTSYAGHKDLEAAVAAGQLTEALAEEMAATRAANAHQGKVGAAQQQASQARARYQQADTQARTDMNTLEAGYRKADPLYNEKQPMIIGMLNEMIRGDSRQGIPPLHPSKWPAAFKKIYETLPKTLGGTRPVARPGAGGKVPANQPLRTQQPAGAQRKEPKSVAEALEMGIEMARGG